MTGSARIFSRAALRRLHDALRDVDLDDRGMTALAELADHLDGAQVEAVRALLVRARRQGRADEKQVRAERRRDRQARRIDDHTFADASSRILRAQGRRAGGDLPAFERLVAHYEDAAEVIGMAARDLIAQGYSWGDVGRALGVTRQAARQRFGRQDDVVTGPTSSGG